MDITAVDEKGVSLISGWEVIEEQSGSDYKYIGLRTIDLHILIHEAF